MFGRIDLTRFQTGLATCRNFITLPHGPAANRPGFEFVREVKNSARKTRLIPFAFNTEQTFAIEFGHLYVRFHTMGATLVDGSSNPYEVVTPYTEDQIFDIHYVQSADVLTLVHPEHAPRELRRLGALNWQLSTITFVPTISAPTGVTATAVAGTGTANNTTDYYVVTALKQDGLEESVASSAASASNDLSLQGARNDITWSAVSGAIRYNVYKEDNGLYGYIGQASGTSFSDVNIVADVTQTPPTISDPFNSAGNYPSAVSYYEQRRVFGGTLNRPQNLWMTRTGTESSMASSIPTRDDDSLAFRIAAREANTIRHIVPLTQLVVLTSSAEWRVSGGNTDAITPTSVSVRPQSYIGANNVQPLVVSNLMLYAQARGGRVREMSYNWQAQGYLSNDISLLAPHLFDYQTIKDMAFVRSPYPIAWCVSSSGKLLGLSYVPEQEVAGWHQHDTINGVFESVCSVAEDNEDALYAIVQRTVNGSQKRYVERLHSRQFEAPEDAFFVDSGLSYYGTPVTNLSGLDHLEGEEVSVLADGAVMPRKVVTGGAITLEQASSVVHVGLPITADLKTLPWMIESDSAAGQGRPKNVNEVWLRVHESSGIFAGPSFDYLTEVKQRTNEPYGSPPALKSEEIRLQITPSWTDSGQVCLRQSDPLPLTLVSMTLQVAIGG
jgi:hypothetical protein